MAEHCIIVGAGHAGVQAAFSLRAKGYDAAVTLLSAEPHRPYERPPLSKAVLLGEAGSDDIALKKSDAYAKRGIELRMNTVVSFIDRAAREVVLDDGVRLGYTALILATGGVPRRLSVLPEDPRVLYLRSLDDALALSEHVKPGSRLAIVGGGYIGLEAAAAAIQKGCAVSVIEAQDMVLGRVASRATAEFFVRHHRARGVEFLFQACVTEAIVTGTGVQLRLSTGDTVAADAVLVGIGAVPAEGLAKAAGLAVADGVMVDGYCRTSDPNIYAIGDVACHQHPLFEEPVRLESVQVAQGQAKAVAGTIVGKPEKFDDVPWFWSNQYDLRLQIVGVSRQSDEPVVLGDERGGRFCVGYLRNDRLVAVDIINSPSTFLIARRLVSAGQQVTPATAAPEILAQLSGAA